MSVKLPLSMRPLAISFSRFSSVLRAVVVAGAITALVQPAALLADVATKSGDKKKDPDDKKARKDKFDYLPEARPVSVRFLDGQVLDVELVAAVGSLKPMEFIIRQAPKHGMLSAPRAHLRENHKGMVTYYHRAGDELTDSFTYSCRLDGGAWSAPATVTLTGQRMAPKIEVVSMPNFGRVFLGGETSSRVMLRNTGAADFRTEVKWPEPFTGPPVIEVARGGAVEFQIFAKPAKTGEFRYDLELQPGVREAHMVLFLSCIKALALSPSRLTLLHDPKSGERSGVLSLANARPQPVRVVMKHPTRLLGPEETELAANSRSDLRIALPVGDVESFAGEIVVIAGDDVQKVFVDARPKPAAVQVLVPASLSLDFGIVDQRVTSTREVVLTNAGGETLTVEARVQAPYTLGGSVRSLRLEPREQGRLKIALNAERLGATAGELELTSNTGRTLVNLAADVREGVSLPAPPTPPVVAVSSVPSPQPAGETSQPTGPAQPADFFANRTAVQSVLQAVLASAGVPKKRSEIDPYLPVIDNIQIVSTSRSDAVLSWPKPANIPPGWIVEVATRSLEPKSQIFYKVWVRHRDWETTEVDGDRIAVRVKNLQPASMYEMRVLAINREGKVSEPTGFVIVQTKLPWRVPPAVWTTLIALALGYVGYRLYKMRDASFSFGQRGTHPTARPGDDAAAEALVQSMSPQAKV
jgi:hypothetical protein